MLRGHLRDRRQEAEDRDRHQGDGRQTQEEVNQLQRADLPIRVSRLLGVDLDELTPNVSEGNERK